MALLYDEDCGQGCVLGFGQKRVAGMLGYSLDSYVCHAFDFNRLAMHFILFDYE